MVEKDTQAVEPAGGAGACAACGNISGNLKACTACRIVKYCNRDCQIKHRPAHKKACKHRLAELHDEKLFQQPPPNDECPICFLPQPIDPLGGVYKPCCGKLICGGCVLTVRTEVGDKKCPFCRTVTHYYFSEFKERMDKRIEANDPRAYANMDSFYMDGRYAQCGLTRDINKAIQYYQKAAELGLDRGHYNLGLAYFTGNHGIEKDVKKATHFLAVLGKQAVSNKQAAYIINHEITVTSPSCYSQQGQCGATPGRSRKIGILDKSRQRGAMWVRLLRKSLLVFK